MVNGEKMNELKMKKINILHLEDSLNDSDLIHLLIERGNISHEYFLAENEKDFINTLETKNIDIILSDYSLPGYNGEKALKVVKEKYSQIPFIFVSGAMGEDAAINAMVNGATDYVLKDKLERLVPAIKRAMNEHEFEVKRKQDEINLIEKNKLIETQNQKYIQINKELEEAKEKAEENDRIKSIFLTNLSQELRTPLNVVLSFSQLITGTNDKQQIINYAKILNNGGNQLLLLIEDLFIVASILSENIIKNIKEVELKFLLDKARFIINDEIIKCNKDIKFSVFEVTPEENVVVLADYDMFGGIIRRLILNAIKFTNKGTIEVGCVTDDKNNIIFYVSDTGIGIPVEKQVIIYDFFRQAEESTIREFGGIGSGLPISKSFAEKMNGTIWLESQPGKGSTFYLKLPLFVKPSRKQATPTNKPNDDLKTEITNCNVLIVDDVVTNRMYLDYILKNKVSKVLFAENGQVALDIVKSTNSVDLILMDINMPIMDGFESTQLIKKIRPDIPVIFQTAFTMPDHKEKAMSAGGDGFILKPINVKELISTMSACLLKNTAN
ncbi:MAG: response regulator [Bacteroidota bacterium]